MGVTGSSGKTPGGGIRAGRPCCKQMMRAQQTRAGRGGPSRRPPRWDEPWRSDGLRITLVSLWPGDAACNLRSVLS